jgi:hypothetical protein
MVEELAGCRCPVAAAKGFPRTQSTASAGHSSVCGTQLLQRHGLAEPSKAQTYNPTTAGARRNTTAASGVMEPHNSSLQQQQAAAPVAAQQQVEECRTSPPVAGVESNTHALDKSNPSLVIWCHNLHLC